MSFDAEAKELLRRRLFARAECDSTVDDGPMLDSTIGFYLCNLMRWQGRGQAYLLCFDKDLRLKRTVRLKRNGREEYSSLLERIVSVVEAYRPQIYRSGAQPHGISPAVTHRL